MIIQRQVRFSSTVEVPHALGVQRQMFVVHVQKTAVVPQFRALLRWPMSLLCRSCWCRRCFLRLWTPCDHAATSIFSSTVEVRQIPCIARVSGRLVVQQRRVLDFQQCWLWRRCRGFRRILCHFRAPLVVPGLSASFSSFRAAHNCECSRAPRVPESPGVYSQVTRHRVCAKSTQWLVDIHPD